MIIDKSSEKGLFFLSGSQQFHMMKNVSESLAGRVGISQPTAERWLSVLIASNIVYLLQPYFNNVIKRIVKTPNLYV